MKKTMSRLLIVVLALVMVIGAFAINASATESATHVTVVKESTDNVWYSTNDNVAMNTALEGFKKYVKGGEVYLDTVAETTVEAFAQVFVDDLGMYREALEKWQDAKAQVVDGNVDKALADAEKAYLTAYAELVNDIQDELKKYNKLKEDVETATTARDNAVDAKTNAKSTLDGKMDEARENDSDWDVYARTVDGYEADHTYCSYTEWETAKANLAEKIDTWEKGDGVTYVNTYNNAVENLAKREEELATAQKAYDEYVTCETYAELKEFQSVLAENESEDYNNVYRYLYFTAMINCNAEDATALSHAKCQLAELAVKMIEGLTNFYGWGTRGSYVAYKTTPTDATAEELYNDFICGSDFISYVDSHWKGQRNGLIAALYARSIYDAALKEAEGENKNSILSAYADLVEDYLDAGTGATRSSDLEFYIDNFQCKKVDLSDNLQTNLNNWIDGFDSLEYKPATSMVYDKYIDDDEEEILQYASFLGTNTLKNAYERAKASYLSLYELKNGELAKKCNGFWASVQSDAEKLLPFFQALYAVYDACHDGIVVKADLWDVYRAYDAMVYNSVDGTFKSLYYALSVVDDVNGLYNSFINNANHTAKWTYSEMNALKKNIDRTLGFDYSAYKADGIRTTLTDVNYALVSLLASYANTYETAGEQVNNYLSLNADKLAEKYIVLAEVNGEDMSDVYAINYKCLISSMEYVEELMDDFVENYFNEIPALLTADDNGLALATFGQVPYADDSEYYVEVETMYSAGSEEVETALKKLDTIYGVTSGTFRSELLKYVNSEKYTSPAVIDFIDNFGRKYNYDGKTLLSYLNKMVKFYADHYEEVKDYTNDLSNLFTTIFGKYDENAQTYNIDKNALLANFARVRRLTTADNILFKNTLLATFESEVDYYLQGTGKESGSVEFNTSGLKTINCEVKCDSDGLISSIVRLASKDQYEFADTWIYVGKGKSSSLTVKDIDQYNALTSAIKGNKEYLELYFFESLVEDTDLYAKCVDALEEGKDLKDVVSKILANVKYTPVAKDYEKFALATAIRNAIIDVDDDEYNAAQASAVNSTYVTLLSYFGDLAYSTAFDTEKSLELQKTIKNLKDNIDRINALTEPIPQAYIEERDGYKKQLKEAEDALKEEQEKANLNALYNLLVAMKVAYDNEKDIAYRSQYVLYNNYYAQLSDHFDEGSKKNKQILNYFLTSTYKTYTFEVDGEKNTADAYKTVSAYVEALDGNIFNNINALVRKASDEFVKNAIGDFSKTPVVYDKGHVFGVTGNALAFNAYVDADDAITKARKKTVKGGVALNFDGWFEMANTWSPIVDDFNNTIEGVEDFQDAVGKLLNESNKIDVTLADALVGQMKDRHDYFAGLNDATDLAKLNTILRNALKSAESKGTFTAVVDTFFEFPKDLQVALKYYRTSLVTRLGEEHRLAITDTDKYVDTYEVIREAYVDLFEQLCKVNSAYVAINKIPEKCYGWDLWNSTDYSDLKTITDLKDAVANANIQVAKLDEDKYQYSFLEKLATEHYTKQALDKEDITEYKTYSEYYRYTDRVNANYSYTVDNTDKPIDAKTYYEYYKNFYENIYKLFANFNTAVAELNNGVFAFKSELVDLSKEFEDKFRAAEKAYLAIGYKIDSGVKENYWVTEENKAEVGQYVNENTLTKVIEAQKILVDYASAFNEKIEVVYDAMTYIYNFIPDFNHLLSYKNTATVVKRSDGKYNALGHYVNNISDFSTSVSTALDKLNEIANMKGGIDYRFKTYMKHYVSVVVFAKAVDNFLAEGNNRSIFNGFVNTYYGTELGKTVELTTALRSLYKGYEAGKTMNDTATLSNNLLLYIDALELDDKYYQFSPYKATFINEYNTEENNGKGYDVSATVADALSHDFKDLADDVWEEIVRQEKEALDLSEDIREFYDDVVEEESKNALSIPGYGYVKYQLNSTQYLFLKTYDDIDLATGEKTIDTKSVDFDKYLKLQDRYVALSESQKCYISQTVEGESAQKYIHAYETADEWKNVNFRFEEITGLYADFVEQMYYALKKFNDSYGNVNLGTVFSDSYSELKEYADSLLDIFTRYYVKVEEIANDETLLKFSTTASGQIEYTKKGYSGVYPIVANAQGQMYAIYVADQRFSGAYYETASGPVVMDTISEYNKFYAQTYQILHYYDRITDLEKAVKELENELTGDINALQKKLEEGVIANILDMINNKDTGLKAQIAALENQINGETGLNARIAALEKTLNDKIDGVKADLEKRIVALESVSDDTSWKQEIADLKTQIANLDASTVAGLTTTVEALEKAIEAEEKARKEADEDLAGDIKSLQDQLSALQKEVEEQKAVNDKQATALAEKADATNLTTLTIVVIVVAVIAIAGCTFAVLSFVGLKRKEETFENIAE